MGRSSGRKRAAVLGFLGLTTAVAGTSPVETADCGDQGAWQPSQQHQHRHGAAVAKPAASSSWTAARPSSDDDVDRRASEFIDRVHRGMLLPGGDNDDDGPYLYQVIEGRPVTH